MSISFNNLNSFPTLNGNNSLGLSNISDSGIMRSGSLNTSKYGSIHYMLNPNYSPLPSEEYPEHIKIALDKKLKELGINAYGDPEGTNYITIYPHPKESFNGIPRTRSGGRLMGRYDFAIETLRKRLGSYAVNQLIGTNNSRPIMGLNFNNLFLNIWQNIFQKLNMMFSFLFGITR